MTRAANPGLSSTGQSGTHKLCPSDPSSHKLSCIGRLPSYRCCHVGIGWKMDQELTAVGVTSADDLRGVPLAKLTKAFGERTAKYMYSACRGEVCNSPSRG